MTTIVSLRTLK